MKAYRLFRLKSILKSNDRSLILKEVRRYHYNIDVLLCSNVIEICSVLSHSIEDSDKRLLIDIMVHIEDLDLFNDCLNYMSPVFDLSRLARGVTRCNTTDKFRSIIEKVHASDVPFDKYHLYDRFCISPQYLSILIQYLPPSSVDEWIRATWYIDQQWIEENIPKEHLNTVLIERGWIDKLKHPLSEQDKYSLLKKCLLNLSNLTHQVQLQKIPHPWKIKIDDLTEVCVSLSVIGEHDILRRVLKDST